MWLQLLLSIFVLVLCTSAFEQDLTVEVRPGRMECFFQEVKKIGGVEIEYQVGSLSLVLIQTLNCLV